MSTSRIRTANASRGTRTAPAPAATPPADLQAQVNALQQLIDAQQAQIVAQQAQIADLRTQVNKCAFLPSLTILDTEFHTPPTEADLEAIRNYVNDMASQLQGGW